MFKKDLLKSKTELSEVVEDAKVALTLGTSPPPLRSERLKPRPADPRSEAFLAEYAELAAVIGIAPPDLLIEEFKVFLLKNDLPVYSLPEVVAYMDEKAAKEAKAKGGWHWRPLREKDHASMTFGRSGHRLADGRGMIANRPASDYYAGPGGQATTLSSGMLVTWMDTSDITRKYDRPSDQQLYDRTIPLHALRRIALIEREFKKDAVAFFVSDYAPLPEIRYPDPFLLAVIPNINVGNGTGRFVIDFWDEPGFGIERMLK